MEQQTNPTAGEIRQQFGKARKLLLQSAPKPAPPKKKSGGDDEKGRASYRKNINRLSAGAFASAAWAMTAPQLPGYLRGFFEAEPAGNNLLDPANAERDLVLGASYSEAFDASDYHITPGPSLDLG